MIHIFCWRMSMMMEYCRDDPHFLLENVNDDGVL